MERATSAGPTRPPVRSSCWAASPGATRAASSRSSPRGCARAAPCAARWGGATSPSPVRKIPWPLRGRLIVGQSGGPTAVINASLAGVIREVHRHEVITGIYGMRHGVEGLLREEVVDLGAEPAETVDRLV